MESSNHWSSNPFERSYRAPQAATMLWTDDEQTDTEGGGGVATQRKTSPTKDVNYGMPYGAGLGRDNGGSHSHPSIPSLFTRANRLDGSYGGGDLFVATSPSSKRRRRRQQVHLLYLLAMVVLGALYVGKLNLVNVRDKHATQLQLEATEVEQRSGVFSDDLNMDLAHGDGETEFIGTGETFMDSFEMIDDNDGVGGGAGVDPGTYVWLRKSDEKNVFNPLDVATYGFAQATRPQLSAFHGFKQWTGPFVRGFTIDWLGVKTRANYDCGRHAKEYETLFSPSYRYMCVYTDIAQHSSDQQADATITGIRPLMDEDYPVYADLLQGVRWRVRAEQQSDTRSKSGKYVIVEVGRQFGMWSVRGLKALHQLAPAMPYKALVVNSDRRKAEAHFSDNGLTMESVKENLRNSSSFMQVLHRYDHIDFLYVGDFQMEAFSTTWNKKRSAQYQFDDALLQLINQKVMRLHLRMDNPQTLQRVVEEFQQRGWLVTLQFPVNPLRAHCDSTLPHMREAFSVSKFCITDTKQFGALYLRYGHVGLVHPIAATDADHAAAAGPPIPNRFENIKLYSAPDLAAQQQHPNRLSAKSDTEAMRRMTYNTRVRKLEDGQYTCEEIGVGNSHDRSKVKFESMQETGFKYCTISYKIGCALPPCIDTGVRNHRWPQPVIYSKFFFDHNYEMQVNDAFLRELLPDYAASSVVLDIGANTGWFTMVAASLGYVVHAVDVQPLCIWHVFTSALENEYEKLVTGHVLGLSTSAGSMVLSEELCKGGLKFDVSQSTLDEQEYRRGKLVPKSTVELMTLGQFVKERVGSFSIRLLKMDTEGAEIDILRSGMALFRSGRVGALVMELGVRYWVDSKGVTLAEGIELLEELRLYFDNVYVFSDPMLPIGKMKDPATVVYRLQEDQMPVGIRGPLYGIASLSKLVENRYEVEHDCNLYFCNDC